MATLLRHRDEFGRVGAMGASSMVTERRARHRLERDSRRSRWCNACPFVQSQSHSIQSRAASACDCFYDPPVGTSPRSFAPFGANGLPFPLLTAVFRSVSQAVSPVAGVVTAEIRPSCLRALRTSLGRYREGRSSDPSLIIRDGLGAREIWPTRNPPHRLRGNIRDARPGAATI